MAGLYPDRFEPYMDGLSEKCHTHVRRGAMWGPFLMDRSSAERIFNLKQVFCNQRL